MIHPLVSHSGVEEFIPVNTLENLIHENEDIGKNNLNDEHGRGY